MSPAPNIALSVFQKLVDLLETPRTIEDLCSEMLISRRTVYRYLTRLADSGVPVVGSLKRPTRYYIPPH